MTEGNLELPRISRPADRALAAAGYTRLDQLTSVTTRDLVQLHGVGPLAIRRLREALAAHGVTFAGEA